MKFLNDIAGSGLNVFGAGGNGTTKQLEELGLLAPGAKEKAQSQSLMRGLLGSVVSYVAQPKNQGYGSGLPYIAKGLQQGMIEAQKPFDNLNATATQNQKIKAYKDEQTDKDNYAEFGKGLGAQAHNDTMQFRVPGNKLNPNMYDSEGNKAGPSMLDSNYRPEDTMEEQGFFNKQKYLNEKLADGTINIDQYNANLPGDDEYVAVGSRLYNKTKKEYVDAGEGAQIDWANMSPAAKEIDKQFGKIISEFTVKGGDEEKQIQELSMATDMLLNSPEGTITGKLAGAALSSGAYKTGMYAEAKAVQDKVLGVVQRSLKATLGAQFTEIEGKMLMERAYDPYLSQKENAARVKRLLTSVQKAYQAKKQMLEFYNKNKTLYGYEGKSLAEIENDVATSLDDTVSISGATINTDEWDVTEEDS